MDVLKQLFDMKRHTPGSGFNLVGLDDHEPAGEQLYTISHHDTRAEAVEAQNAFPGDDETFIYGAEESE